ncbi:MAG TPA: FHA domain-containing protein [Archangium sp.]|nr:FHA domain-containing protein [Archangium sp.]
MFTFTVVLSGSKSVTRGTLSSREVFVGRSRKCDVVLRDDTVSGVHCRLVAIEGGAIVMDEGSTNGTWLNGSPVVRPTVMTADDELRIGPYSMRVQSLVGGDNTNNARPPVAAPAQASLPRPHTTESATDLRVPQALVFWRILGFDEATSLDEARAAYVGLMMQHTPEELAKLSPERRAAAELRLREIDFAWDYLQRLWKKAAQQDKGAA